MPFGFPNTGGSHPGAVASVDSIEAVGVRLTTVDASSFNDGDLIYVGNETFAGQGSIKDYVRVRRNASLTPTEGEVWNSATAGVQFERLHTPSASQLQRLVWTVTQDDGLGTAIIDNDGFGANPVSMREVNRRRAGDSQGIGSSIFIQMPDMSSPIRPELLACTLSNWWGVDGNSSPVILGVVAANLYAGVVTSFAPAVHGAGTGYILGAVGIGTAFESVPGILQALVQLSTQAKTAVIQEALDADHVLITQPRTSDPSSFSVGAVTTFAVGNNIIVPTLPVLPIWPFVPGAFEFVAVGEVSLSGFDSEFNSMDFGDNGSYVINCLIGGNTIKGGNIGSNFACVGLNGNNTFDVGQVSMWSCGAGQALNVETPTVGRVNIVNGVVETIDNFDLHNCVLLARGGRLQVDADLSCFGFDGALSAMLRADNGGIISISGEWWGGVTSPNGCPLAQISPTATLLVTAANVLVTTGGGFDFNVLDGGPGTYPRTAISIINPLGGGVIDAAILRSVGAATFSGALVTSAGGATTSFMANPGTALALANQAAAQAFPASRRIIRSLTVTKRATGASVNVVYTVYIAGGTTATAMVVTMLATDPVGTQKTYNAIPIILGTPQDVDVRMSAAVDATPGTALASATVQFG